MRMDGQDESSNVEDVRGMGGGGGGGFGFGGRSIGIGTVAVALIAGWIFGINPLTILGMAGGGEGVQQSAPQGPRPSRRPNDPQAQFVSKVLRSTEDVWADVFRAAGRTYQAPKLFSSAAAGRPPAAQGQAAMGPFYCPDDAQGLHRPRLLRHACAAKLGAPGEFAQAYVIAHEVGHHVQTLLGIMDKVDAARRRGCRDPGQRAQRAARTAGRLLRRRLGQALAAGEGLGLEQGDIEWR